MEEKMSLIQIAAINAAKNIATLVFKKNANYTWFRKLVKNYNDSESYVTLTAEPCFKAF
jgi:hypothetical protein